MPNRLSTECLLEQLAEECCELAQAALKKARIIRAENPTPKTMIEVEAAIKEELTDVALVCDILDIKPDNYMYNYKSRRWKGRLDDVERSQMS